MAARFRRSGARVSHERAEASTLFKGRAPCVVHSDRGRSFGDPTQDMSSTRASATQSSGTRAVSPPTTKDTFQEPSTSTTLASLYLMKTQRGSVNLPSRLARKLVKAVGGPTIERRR